MMFRSSLRHLVVLAGLSTLAAVGSAQPYAHETHIDLYAGAVSGSYSSYDTFAPMSRQATDPFAGTARGTSYMGYGYNHVSAQIGNTAPTDYLSAQVSNRWSDTVTIDAPGMTGLQGAFTASLEIFCDAQFSLTGAYASDPNASVMGFWNAWIGSSNDGGTTWATGDWGGSWARDMGNPGQMSYSGDALNGVQWDITIDFTFGQEFRLGSFLESVVIGENPNLGAGSLNASLDFTPPSLWNGISGIYDADSNLIMDASLVSGSGTNYMVAVPEPSITLGVGLGLAAMLRRRKKR